MGRSDTHQLHFMEMMGFAGSTYLRAPLVPRMLRSAPHLRRGALLIRGPSCRSICFGSRLCGAARRALHRVRDTSGICSRRRVVICPSGGLLTSDEAIHSFLPRHDGLLRGACHRARIRATRSLAMTDARREHSTRSPTSRALLSANDHTRRVFSRGIKLRMTGDSARSTGSQVVLKRSTPLDSSAVKRPSTSM